MKKLIIVIIIIVIGAGIGIYLYSKKGSVPSPAETTSKPLTGAPLVASSYGKNAPGTTTATSSSGATGSPVVSPVQEAGAIMGQAKPVPGSAAKPNFTAMQLSLSDPKTNQVLVTVKLAADGSYKFNVEPGEYVMNFVKGTGTSAQLPQRVYVGPKETLVINFFVK